MIYFLMLLFFIGTILGSFYGVLGSRLPKGESIVKPSSHCESCQHQLKWYELIPIFSYVFQRGKCSSCKAKLSFMYPAVELFTGLLFVVSFLQFGLSYEFFLSLILSSLVIIIFVSDLKYMIILDSPLVVSIILIFLLKWFYLGPENALISLLNGFLLFLTMLIIGKLGDHLFKKESLGGGDIKLSFVSGMALGYTMGLVALVFSTFLALPYALLAMQMKKSHEVPFGPFLVSSLWIVFFFYEKFSNIIPFILNL